MSGWVYRELLTSKFIVPKDTHPSLKGQTIVVTGANSGLGFEASLKFVQCGADKVILAVRTLSKGEEAKRLIDQKSGRGGVTEVWQLDMLSYDSIKAFANKANTELGRLDVLCLNAGVVFTTFQLSNYGYEKTLQVNVLSTTLLALLLLPKLDASRTATHTPVLELIGSATSYLQAKLASDNAPFAAYNQAENFKIPDQYNVSKVFVNYIQESLLPLVEDKETGKPNVYVVAADPGPTKSELGRDATSLVLRIAGAIFHALFQRSTEQGARAYISGVAQAEQIHGRFWKDDRVRESVFHLQA
jgi:NAD(P)-dependent dehydrogenase (short-subunit alcohol dehydrogenase family)